mmetsp:Transcript_2894/g.9821  ORF Transcript_2894/g.9821 Transcript_2894/m.9821 type:complete len:216 (-) Transcript_2894:285-932(-)
MRHGERHTREQRQCHREDCPRVVHEDHAHRCQPDHDIRPRVPTDVEGSCPPAPRGGAAEWGTPTSDGKPPHQTWHHSARARAVLGRGRPLKAHSRAGGGSRLGLCRDLGGGVEGGILPSHPAVAASNLREVGRSSTACHALEGNGRPKQGCGERGGSGRAHPSWLLGARSIAASGGWIFLTVLVTRSLSDVANVSLRHRMDTELRNVARSAPGFR